MGFKVDKDDSVTSVGYFSSGAFSAREIVEQVTRSFEEDWEVSPGPRSSYGDYYGEQFKITITVEKV